LQRPVYPLLLRPAVLLELCPPAAVLLLLLLPLWLCAPAVLMLRWLRQGPTLLLWLLLLLLMLWLWGLLLWRMMLLRLWLLLWLTLWVLTAALQQFRHVSGSIHPVVPNH
jgi:hypothetical protein